ncbi:15164_t:CDS:2 [Funneliformis geosporum]|uniref:15164_t:CDS:1 n=1 Tax=Funneliformis geosporum TaxID=1117311 RepID=A0A9W4SUM3_9GLOM|nr:15164_t:CDS:2 [Funneliformis geosporum]
MKLNQFGDISSTWQKILLKIEDLEDMSRDVINLQPLKKFPFIVGDKIKDE